MPLITPQQVKDYTDFPKVQERADAKLAFDITQAESDVFSYVGHRFTEPEYIPLPDEVKTALILLTEHYALIRTDKALVKGYTSEKLDDYSYTRKDGDVFANKPEIANLLKSFVKGGSGRCTSPRPLMAFEEMLSDRCTIKRQIPLEPGYDDYGNPVTETTLGTIATNVPCYMVRKTHDLIQSPSYQTLRENWKVTFPIDTDVQVNDILVIDDMELVAGTPRNVKDHHLSVFATQDIAL